MIMNFFPSRLENIIKSKVMKNEKNLLVQNI